MCNLTRPLRRFYYAAYSVYDAGLGRSKLLLKKIEFNRNRICRELRGERLSRLFWFFGFRDSLTFRLRRNSQRV